MGGTCTWVTNENGVEQCQRCERVKQPEFVVPEEEEGEDLDIENHDAEEQKETELLNVHHACLADNLDKVKQFIETEGVDVNATEARIDSKYGILKKVTPLHCASIAGNIPIVEYLIASNAALDKVANYSETEGTVTIKLDNVTPLHLAIKYKRDEVITTLLDASADTAAVANYIHENESDKKIVHHDKVNSLHLAALFHPKIENAILANNESLRDVLTADGKKYSDLRATEPLKLIILGPPAGGKGTVCEVIKNKYNVVHLSTGDILRENISKETELGGKVKPFMEQGLLVPDELIIDMVTQRLSQKDCQERGWLLDGFPRTPEQSRFMVEKGIVPTAVLVLKVDDSVVELRMGGRRLDPETGLIYHVQFNPAPTEEIAARLITRPDDTSDKIKTRLENYYKHAQAVTSSFEGRTIDIDGNGDSQTVGRIVTDSIDGLGK